MKYYNIDLIRQKTITAVGCVRVAHFAGFSASPWKPIVLFTVTIGFKFFAIIAIILALYN